MENEPENAATVSSDLSKQDVVDYIANVKNRLQQKCEARNKNLKAHLNRPDETVLRRLDSNLKKNTAFVKKIKSFTESQKASIIKDFQALNLSKYVTELATSVGEAKLKMSDLPAMVEFCSLVHQTYAEFDQTLLDSHFKKVLPRKKDDQVTNLSRLRVDLRLLADLISAGVLAEKDALPVLGAALTFLVQCDKDDHCHLPVLSTFCRSCGEDYGNYVASRYQVAATRCGLQLPETVSVLAPERRKPVVNLMKEYYAKLNKDLTWLFKETKRLERSVQRQYDTRGEVSEDARRRLTDSRAALAKLNQAVCQLADSTNQAPPELAFDPLVDDPLAEQAASLDDGGAIVAGRALPTADEMGGGLWEDVETQSFYESLPQLRQMLPGILFRDSEKPTLPVLEDKCDETDELQDAVESAEKESSGELLETIAEGDEEEAGAAGVVEDAEKAASDVVAPNLRDQLNSFLDRLPTLVNRDLIDQAAVDFVSNLNNKASRNKLLAALYAVPRTRVDLLPFYARLVASLQPVMPDLGTQLVQQLISDFRRHLRRKDQLFKVEEKLKCVKFIGELVKFKVCPRSEALHCFKMMLFDFRHHAIDMACGLLDTCGYYLYHSPESHQRTKILLEQMTRKRQANINLDSRYQLMLDNSYFCCIPPTAGVIAKIVRSTLEQYVRFSMLSDLQEDAVEKILKRLRRLDWDSKEAPDLVVDYLSRPWLVTFANVEWLASLLAGLTFYYDFVGHRVVDNVLEEHRLGLEINHTKLNQRRLCCARYLGEMYNFRVVDSGVIFNFLYSLVTFGVSYDLEAQVPSFLDPPEHLFRIRLACACLETCGEFFDRGLGKKKLDIYLTYLQRYFLLKYEARCWNEETLPFPVEIENCLYDLLDRLRPKLEPFDSLETANDAVKAIESEYRTKLEAASQSSAGEDDLDDDEDQKAPENSNEDDDALKIAQRRSGEHVLLASVGQNENGDADQTSMSLVDADDLFDDQVTVRLDVAVDDAAQLEDELFKGEFDRFLSECVASRAVEQVKPAVLDINVSNVLKMKKHARFENQPAQTEPDEADANKNDSMKFFLITKGKGNKTALKSIELPYDLDWVKAKQAQELEELEEKRRVKEKTLSITQRMLQEEEQEERQQLKLQVERIVQQRAHHQYGHK